MKKSIFYIVLVLSLLFVSDAKAVKITESDFAEAVKKQALEQGVINELELEFFAGATEIDLPEANKFKIMVLRLDFDETQNKFSAKAEVYANSKMLHATDLTGRYYELVSIYVPAQNVAKGELIEQKMLKTIKIRKNRLKSSFLTEESQLLNKQATKSLRMDKPVFENEVREMPLINKNDMVTVVYEYEQMQITVKAQALEDGAKGQIINLLNTKTKKTIQAEVKDKNTVVIRGEK